MVSCWKHNVGKQIYLGDGKENMWVFNAKKIQIKSPGSLWRGPGCTVPSFTSSTTERSRWVRWWLTCPQEGSVRHNDRNTEMDAFLLCLPHLLLRWGEEVEVARAERETVLAECLDISSLLTGITTWVTAQVALPSPH